LIFHCDDYTTAWYIIHEMKPEIELPDEDEAEVAADGTGLKFGSAGEYRTYIYGNIRRRYVKVVITADIRTKKLIDVHAYIGEGSEAEIAVKQIKRMQDNGIKLKKFYGDGAYDTNEVFYAIEDAESAIMIRKNGSTCCRGNRRRREEIRKYFSLRYKA